MMQLNNPSLFQQNCYIDGRWVTVKKTIKVKNPATEETIGTVPDLETANILDAISAADAAWPM